MSTPAASAVPAYRSFITPKITEAQINSEKHGCKCYMDGLSAAEQEVADLLTQELGYKDYFIFNNIIIPSENNGSTQIDHLVISKFGIFVIESKDYAGWIFGSPDHPVWTQSLAGGHARFTFQNPVRQNWAHIMALKTLMPLEGEIFHNLIVFSERCEFKTSRIENVLYVHQLIGFIKKFNTEIISEAALLLVIGKLSYLCQVTDISHEEHVSNVQNALEKKIYKEAK